MASYTIVTTDAQEAALAWTYAQSQVPRIPPGAEAPPVLPEQTQAEFLQAQVEHLVLNLYVQQYLDARAAEARHALGDALVASGELTP
jgi:hypothetical protein